jgi:Mg-chelatase subunit ChlD
MQSLRWFEMAALLGILLLGSSAIRAADKGMQTQADRRAIQVQLHSHTMSERLDAVRQLASFPPVEGAKLVMQVGLVDRDPEVRHAAYQTLLTWKNNREVSTFLFKTLEKDYRSKAGPSMVVPIVAAVLASERQETQQRLGKFLDNYLAKSKDAPAVIGAVADEFGMQADEQALVSLKNLSEKRCFTTTFPCRRATVQAMTHIQRPEAITTLLAVMPKVDGEVRGDVIRCLEDVSGEHFGLDLKAWQAWWKEHAQGFEFPARAAQAPAGNPVGGKPVADNPPANAAVRNAPGNAARQPESPSVTMYYGMPIYARRVVFVVDISGSMFGPRLAAAKRELTNAINGLPENTELGVVAFSSQVNVWQRDLVRATPAAKQDAAAFVYNLAAGGRTAAFDALDTAFRYDAEAVFFLSDGEPNGGKIVVPAAIVATISRVNRARRVSIYTIGIAPGVAGGADETFMKALAEQNFGQFRRLDQ